jgi:hypothetical protein
MQWEIELFEAAGHLIGLATRRAYLEQACSQDAAMRDRIEELLTFQSDAEKFFATAENELSSLLRQTCDVNPVRPEHEISKRKQRKNDEGSFVCKVSGFKPC